MFCYFWVLISSGKMLFNHVLFVVLFEEIFNFWYFILIIFLSSQRIYLSESENKIN